MGENGPPPGFGDLIVARAGDGHPAIFFEDETISYAQFVDASATRAALLRDARRPGPFHVGVLLENVPEFLYWIGGAALAGAAVVGINPTRRGDELAHDVRHTDCQLLVTDREGAALLEGLDLGIDRDSTLTIGTADYDERIGEHAGAEVPAQLPEWGTPLLLLFTSGSTSAPKAVVCSTGRLAAAGIVSAPAFGITRESVCYQAMPLFHGNALMANWLPALGLGATVAMRRRFSASGFLPDVRRYRATYFNYVGRAVAYVLATPPSAEDRDHRLRFGFGTEASSRDRERFEERFGCPLVETYGSSEAVLSMQRTPDTPPAALGVPLAGIDAVVIDPETKQECPRAKFDEHGALVNGDQAIGELVNRDPGDRFEGYYGNAEAENERLRDGWYWSGDLAYRDDDGFFYFAGRDADWLRVDSENFAAAPIERIVARYEPAVMVAVYPVPDPRTGDQVMAAIEGEFDPDEFAAFLDAQPDLGTKWAPRFVRVVESMPLTANTKVDKKPLRTEAWVTDDPVWWRPGRELSYRRLTSADVEALRADALDAGRSVP